MVVEPILPIVARLVAMLLPVFTNLIAVILPIVSHLVPVSVWILPRAVFAVEPIAQPVTPLFRRPGGQLAGPAFTQPGKSTGPIANAVPQAAADGGAGAEGR
jgi:hypothetical protein